MSPNDSPQSFPVMPEDLQYYLALWRDHAGPRLRIDSVPSFSGDLVYAITLSDFSVASTQKQGHYFAQPHAHEPGTTAGMMDAIHQIVTGYDLEGKPTSLDREAALRQSILTFNPIGNPWGRSRAPVRCWDGTYCTNEQFACWMRGTDPEHPGKMWKRLDVWDRRTLTAPDPVGIVYEPIDEDRFVEPNRSRLSSYFRLFMKMDRQHHYTRWLDLHQHESFPHPQDNCELLLPLAELVSPANEQVLRSWSDHLVQSWAASPGLKPVYPVRRLSYTGQEASYFRQCWGDLHQRMPILNTEIINNASTAAVQKRAQSIAVIESIRHLIGDV